MGKLRAACIVLLLLHACNETDKTTARPPVRDTSIIRPASEYASIDQSPLDISYCPTDYPQQKMENAAAVGLPVARIIYSRPHKKGRLIFGKEENSLCSYGKAWRLGANEATEIEFFKPVVINSKNLNAGRYIMYCIPYPDKWIIVFNSNLNSWGLNIDPSKDLFTTEIPVQHSAEIVEDFTMLFTETATGADLIMAWDDVKTFLPVTYSK